MSRSDVLKRWLRLEAFRRGETFSFFSKPEIKRYLDLKNEGITKATTWNTLSDQQASGVYTKDTKLTIIRSIYRSWKGFLRFDWALSSQNFFFRWPFHWISLSSINSGVVYLVEMKIRTKRKLCLGQFITASKDDGRRTIRRIICCHYLVKYLGKVSSSSYRWTAILLSTSS